MKTEPGSAPPALLSSTGEQTDLDLWNHHLTSSLDMDKKSEPNSQPSTRRGRGDRPNNALSLSTPSPQTNIVPASSAAAAQSHTGQVPGWHPHPPSVPTNAPGNVEEVARALRTIQDAYPFLVQSMAHHQQAVPRDPNQLPRAVPPQVTLQPPWPLNQPSTSQGGTIPNYTPGFGQLGFPPGNYSAPNVHYPVSQLSTPIIAASGESTFQGFTPAQTQESAPVDPEAMSEEKRRRNTAASARFRVKKKIKAHNLERNVSDLSGRVDELEQEAADLRRENGWLKEIIVLKSSTAREGDFLAGPSQPLSSQDEEGNEEGKSEEDDK